MKAQTDKTKTDPHLIASRSLLDFIDRSPTPFHAVDELRRMLAERSFMELKEADSWNIAPGGKYFVVRNDSSLVALKIGSRPPETAGYKIIGAHTDSPNLRLKPNPVYAKSGYVQLGIEVYGGVLLSTWTDRDLSLAGRVILREAGARTVCRLTAIGRPLLRIPQLAIHLNRQINEKGLILNAQTHMPPVLSLADGKTVSDAFLKHLLAEEVKCKPEDIVGMDISLYDVQKGALAGPDYEFVFSPRLDNLASCHAAVTAFLESPEQDAATQILAFYDNEEVGSATRQGAGSPFLRDILERGNSSREAAMRALARSVFISADMAHAVHPNYSDLHDPQHLPVINKGPVIKTHAGQRYATDGATSAHFELLCEKAGVATQKFVMRSDLACGSTIGPITAANLGIPAADIGNPMLSMHSAREMAGSRDHLDLIRVFREYFKPE